MKKKRKRIKTGPNLYSHKHGGAPSRSHGGYRLKKEYQEHGLDLRRRDHKVIQRFRDAVISDLGGLENVNSLQMTLLDRCSEILIVLNAIAKYAKTKPIVDRKGNLLSCLGRSHYLSWQNALRKDLEVIFSHRKDVKPKENLDDYLEATYSEVVDDE